MGGHGIKRVVLPVILGLLLFSSCDKWTEKGSGPEPSLAICNEGWLANVLPGNGEVEVPVDAVITLTMSDAIEPKALECDRISITASSESPLPEGRAIHNLGTIAGEILCNADERRITFTPQVPFPAGTKISVAANFEPCNNADSPLVLFSFETASPDDAPAETQQQQQQPQEQPQEPKDILPPSIVTLSPADKASSIPLNAKPAVVFSEEVLVAEDAIRLFNRHGAPVAARVAYDKGSFTAVLTPEAELEPLSTYELRIAGIKDPSGNAAKDTTVSFTTKEIPDLVAPSTPTPSLKPFTRATFTWTAPGDDGESGKAARYEMRFSPMPIAKEEDYAAATPLPGLPVPGSAGAAELFTPKRMTPGAIHVALRAFDEAGNVSALASVPIAIAGRSTLIAEPKGDRIQNDRGARNLAGRCDINGDGLADLLVGSPYDSTPGSMIGRVLVVLGKAGDLPGKGAGIAREPDIIINGIDSSPLHGDDVFGSSVSCGDFNGDGFDDIAAGATSEDTSDGKAYAPQSGAAYLFFGSKKLGSEMILSAAQADVIFQGRATSDYFGYAVMFLGDLLGGDGKEELAVVAAWGDVQGNDGIVYIFSDHGATGGKIIYDLEADMRVIGEGKDTGLYKIGAPGDIDGNGLPDLAFATPFTPATNMGSLYIVLNDGRLPKTIPLKTNSSFVVRGVANYDHVGGAAGYDPSFSLRGDLNGDGIRDLVVSAPVVKVTHPYDGIVAIFSGRPSWNTKELRIADADLQITGTISERAGWIVDAGGDFNHDGRDDLLISAPLFDGGSIGPDAGGAFIFYGHGGWQKKMTILDADVIIGRSNGTLQDIGLAPISNSDAFGFSALFLGDSNGDEYDDIALGSPLADLEGITDAGAIFVVQ